jgi:hypothetical protein
MFGNFNNLGLHVSPEIIRIQQYNRCQWILMKFHGGDGDGQFFSTPVTSRVDDGQIAQFLEMILTGQPESFPVFD